jgi:hypothetical protein
MELCNEASSPNAQLRALNLHIGNASSNAMCALLVHASKLSPSSGPAGVSSFGFAGTIAHSMLHASISECVKQLPPSMLAFRRLVFLWREPPRGQQVHVPVFGRVHADFAVALPRPPMPSLVTLGMSNGGRVATIELNDPSRFNALGDGLAEDVASAVHYLTVRATPEALVFQAAGPHFCIGGFPHDQHVEEPLSKLAANLHEIARGCCKLRAITVPSVAAVHGHLIGGGLALSLCATTMYAHTHT